MSQLSEILSSKVRADVFRLLFGIDDESLHMREIERRSGCAIGTIQTELKKMLRLNLVLKRKDGNRLYYRANKAHQLYADIRSIVLKTNGLAELVYKALKNEPAIKIAFVFGSFARNAEKSGSDLDLMVIGNLGLRKLTDVLSGVTSIIHRDINPYVLTKEEFHKRIIEDDHFISNVMNSPKIFIIGSENELAAMGG